MTALLRRLVVVVVFLVTLIGVFALPVRGEPSGSLGREMTLDDRTVVDKVSLEQMQAIMKSEGYTWTLTEKHDILWKIDGYNVVILVMDSSLSCLFGYNDITPSLEQINAWNRSKRFSTSYLNEKGHPFLELDLELDRGVTVGRIKDYLKTCRVSISKWSAELVK